MIDIKLLRENPDYFEESSRNKGVNIDVSHVLEIDNKYKEINILVQEIREKRNLLVSAIKAMPGGKPTANQIAKGKELRESLEKEENALRAVEEELYIELGKIPNPARSDVKIGKNESGNEIIKTWGEPTKFNFTPLDHLALGTKLGILDFETGAKVSGSQFYYLYGDGAMLELALIQYAFDTLQKEGFLPVITPDLAKSRYYLGTGYNPKGDEAQTYTIEDEDLGLIATAEVTLAGKHADDTVLEKDLPIKYVGYSHCFRKEAGAYGKYSKGMYRVHQFTKAEMFIYCKAEDSDALHDYLLEMEEKIYQNLNIPYRVIKQCTGDLGAMAARKYDIEAWMPGRNDYGEVTSTSNCTDYQSRNLNIRYVKEDGTKEYIHMLNGTAVATSRTPIAILENYQQEDGSVVVPEVLRKYLGKDILRPF